MVMKRNISDYRYIMNWETILTILGVIFILYLIAHMTGNTYESFSDPTWCSPCETQSSSDPTYCLSCENCYYDNGVCKSLYDNSYVWPYIGIYNPPIYGFNSNSWIRPWNWNWNTWVR